MKKSLLKQIIKEEIRKVLNENLSKQEKKWKTRGTQEYIELAQRCLNSMQEVQPLSSELDDRLTYKDFRSSNYQIKQDSV